MQTNKCKPMFITLMSYMKSIKICMNQYINEHVCGC